MNVELEYRVRPVTRYVVTRFSNADANAEKSASSGSVEMRGEFDNQETADAVAYALCKREHEILEWPIDDMRIKYPDVSDNAVGLSP